MKRILIIGCTGSGKSTMGKALGQRLGIPFTSLDELYWQPGWQETPDAEFFPKIEAVVAREKWIIDGNYGRTNHLTWPHADTIIWIDLPFWTNFWQLLLRSIRRSITREELWPGTQCRESFWRMFSRDSILLWLIKTYRNVGRRYRRKKRELRNSGVRFIHLRSRKQMQVFIDSCVPNAKLEK